ncbi:related to effector family protein Eff1 [Sporisorium reilianum f. sp. reilianum]|uniref:Related to effector family protein Eff1 n=1 Tax=Sporisorium reilianum f. sp. reilianum TaxID=72559 RepID=A0A2N8UCP5_9BASI|nr:related to effector family protein Eff1 [Sporisorium reilianum f. sp. reilianum]
MLMLNMKIFCFLAVWAFGLVLATPMWNGGQNSYQQGQGSSQPPNAAQPWQAGSSYVPANQYWDAHGQPLPMTANDYPAHPSTPQFIEQPEPPLDDEDFAFLSELERSFATPQPVTPNHSPALSVPHGSYAGFRAPVQSFDQLSQYNWNKDHAGFSRQDSQPATTADARTRQESSSHGRQTELNAAVAAGKRPRQSKSTKGKGVAIQQSLDWPRPFSLNMLDTQTPLKTESFSATVIYRQDQGVQKRLNDRYFGGRMEWIAFNQIPIPHENAWVHRSPLNRNSLLLPASRNEQKNGVPAEVVITTHHLEDKRGRRNTKETPIHGKLYYMVWNVPVQRQSHHHKIEHLGTGIISKEHNDDVDKAMFRILDKIKGASHGPK